MSIRPLPNVNRIMIIGTEGIEYSAYGVTAVEQHFQDCGETLKIFCETLRRDNSNAVPKRSEGAASRREAAPLPKEIEK